MATNPRYANGNARRKLRKRLLDTTTVCALCGGPLPNKDELKHMDPSDPRYPVVDEIMPICRGGDPLSKDNTQLVHRICNARKGSKIIINKKLLQNKKPVKTSHKWDKPGLN